MTPDSMILTGAGEATTHRHPRPESSTKTFPVAAISLRASSSPKKAPTGFVGCAKAGSPSSTRVWVMRDRQSLSIPRRRISFPIASWRW